ncbi:TonB-dependent receptor-like protein [Gillisia sp. Hel_I_86]|uniref:M56 family metallopeptidase n=1 Tax=Gillisia sp. Hel_I_86 TaxID=1249981 RepID=UPI00119A66BD|nr:M56 family metallopeptidase [Gillisia sp. Hel_I_86]TVZ25668.1 TonB-dependent receptor-like protein [Gillisia sp. Hel_I_86]
MESLLTYLLKSAGLLSLFYLLYIVLLKNDTSFTANRKFLLGGIFTSLVLPAIYFTKRIMVNAPEIVYSESSLNSNFITIPESTSLEMDWWMIAGTSYLIITGFFLLRFCFRIFQIYKMIHFSNIKKEGKFKIVETLDIAGPFSFFNYLFINTKTIPEEEYPIMLRHEKVHASQFHSFDMLASHLLAAILWFNPISWYYKKAVEQNLEFIADHETAQALECIQQYQHVLVKVTTNQYQSVLVNHFYQSFIKKRIVMLNKKSSNHSNISKMSLILPLLLAFMLTFNVKTEAKVKQGSKVVINDVQFYPDALASAIITKNSTKEQLEDVAREFKKQGAELQFKKLKFSKEGMLTRINIKYAVEKTGDSGNFNKNGDSPIDDIEIILSEDLKIEFRSPNNRNKKNEFVFISDSNPLGMDATLTHETIGYKEDLGDVTKERIIVVDPNKNISGGPFSVGNKVHYYSTDSDSISGNGKIINVNTKNGNRITWTSSDTDTIKSTYRIIVLDSSHTNASNISKEIKVISREKKDRPLYIVDGVVKNDDFNSEKINPSNIENVYVLKDSSAIRKYGAKGINGVVQINTINNKLFKISPKMTDAELENLKLTVASTTGFKLSLDDIKRNKKGLISTISIKFKDNSRKMVSGNYSESAGISDIYFGEKEGGTIIIYSN